MKIIFHKKDFTDSFTISPFVSDPNHPNRITIWLGKEDGEGGTFDANEVSDVIFNALKGFYDKNF